jgi:hypothetical protein
MKGVRIEMTIENSHRNRRWSGRIVVFVLTSAILGLGLHFMFLRAKRIPVETYPSIFSDRFDAYILSELKISDCFPLRLEDITDFEWDRVYIFHPYTPDSEMQRSLGMKVQFVPNRIQHNDAYNLLVFVKDGRIVTAVETALTVAEFHYDETRVFERANADFRVRPVTLGDTRGGFHEATYISNLDCP